ncbi:DUF423 domain-containing protein [Undibacterium sp. Jales W-56]|uniref:DUF423 domain-containing protein n=1 Tax=Undibacterium sp. Jales W-56 TaxID=2897325 RepID=UPI0021CE0213|nr:DUF423 domain-containing protein [Undibacterium sp. Jales W-56]MCU6435003.1 DUF423 domain-containing protein [Undibacterium sp. Jales W-56]
MTQRLLIIIAALNMLIAVAAGAFGAHGLKTVLSPEMLAVWQTAASYQTSHALGLFGIALLLPRWPSVWLLRAAAAMLSGIVIFSGSLYLLAVTGLRWLGAITPIGGLALLLAWAMLAWAAYRDTGVE